MRTKRPYFKQKLRLYFDENFPERVVRHFSASYWNKKIKIITASGTSNLRKSDRFHYRYCLSHGHTLVTLDMDFNNDRLYAFTDGKMSGIIIIRASSSEVWRIIEVLSRLLTFLLTLPFPRAFLLETKIVAGRDGVLMRGRDASTKEVKAIRITPGVTTAGEIREAFSY